MRPPSCDYHPDRDARHQCLRCGRMLCDECYDPERRVCKYENCRPNEASYRANEGRREDRPPNPRGGQSGMNTGCRIVVAILAIIGGIFLLLLAICGGMLFLNY